MVRWNPTRSNTYNNKPGLWRNLAILLYQRLIRFSEARQPPKKGQEILWEKHDKSCGFLRSSLVLFVHILLCFQSWHLGCLPLLHMKHVDFVPACWYISTPSWWSDRKWEIRPPHYVFVVPEPLIRVSHSSSDIRVHYIMDPWNLSRVLIEWQGSATSVYHVVLWAAWNKSVIECSSFSDQLLGHLKRSSILIYTTFEGLSLIRHVKHRLTTALISSLMLQSTTSVRSSCPVQISMTIST